MQDFRWDLPETEEIELDDEELERLDRAIENARNGPWYSIEEVREMIPQWIARYASQDANSRAPRCQPRSRS